MPPLSSLQPQLSFGIRVAGDRDRIFACVSDLRRLLTNGNAGQIRAATEALNHASEALAARLMDAALHQGLAGRQIEQLIPMDGKG